MKRDDIEVGQELDPDPSSAIVCDACHYEGARVKAYRHPTDGDAPPNLFCRLCASTFGSHHVEYPSLCGDERHVMATLCYGLNAIYQVQEKTIEALLGAARAIEELTRAVTGEGVETWQQGPTRTVAEKPVLESEARDD